MVLNSFLIARIILGLILIVSGALKLPNIKGFYLIILSYGIFKGKLAKLFSYLTPFVEILVGIFLIINFQVKLFSLVALIMIFSYTCGLCLALVKKKKMENCGCFGTAVNVPLNWSKVAENLILIFIALYLFFA